MAKVRIKWTYDAERRAWRCTAMMRLRAVDFTATEEVFDRDQVRPGFDVRPVQERCLDALDWLIKDI